MPAVKEVRPEFARIHSQVLQDVILRLDRAYKGFFRRVKAGQRPKPEGAAFGAKKRPGYPRFKGRDRYDSFTYPQAELTGVKFLENGNRAGATRPKGSGATRPKGSGATRPKVYLSGIGNLRVKLHRPLEGRVKTASIKREGQEWYIVFTNEVFTNEVEDRPMFETGSSVGIDLGLSHFLVTSDGEFVDNPRHFRVSQKKLRVARVHRKVARQRLDFHHKAARKLVNANDLIAHEDLKVIGLARTHLARSVHDAGWSQFILFRAGARPSGANGGHQAERSPRSP